MDYKTGLLGTAEGLDEIRVHNFRTAMKIGCKSEELGKEGPRIAVNIQLGIQHKLENDEGGRRGTVRPQRTDAWESADIGARKRSTADTSTRIAIPLAELDTRIVGRRTWRCVKGEM